MNTQFAHVVRIPFVVLFVVTLMAGAAVASTKPEVSDDAQLLDAATVDRVNDIVKEIKQKFGKDLTIETFVGIPKKMQARFAAENKAQFYEDWLRQEAIAAETNGVFILIVKDPYHLQIGVGKTTSPHIFTISDRDELRDMMLKSLRERKFNDAIEDGATFVLRRMEQNQSGKIANTPESSTAPTPTQAVERVAPAPATQPASKFPATQPAPAVAPLPPSEHSSAHYETTRPVESGPELNK